VVVYTSRLNGNVESLVTVVAATAVATTTVAAAVSAATTIAAAVTAAATVTTAAATTAVSTTASASATVTTTATVATAASAAVTTAAATGAFFAGLGFIDGQATALEFSVIHGLDGGFDAIGHFDEAETAGAAGFAILDDLGLHYGAELGERLRQIFARGGKRQIADVQILHAAHAKSPGAPAVLAMRTPCNSLANRRAAAIRRSDGWGAKYTDKLTHTR